MVWLHSIALDGLALIEEILEEERNAFHAFLELSDPWSSFPRIMQTKGDTFCTSSAARTISYLLYRSKQTPEDQLSEVMQWCNDQLRDPTSASMALEGLRNLLRHDDIRVRFFVDDVLQRGHRCSVPHYQRHPVYYQCDQDSVQGEDSSYRCCRLVQYSQQG